MLCEGVTVLSTARSTELYESHTLYGFHTHIQSVSLLPLWNSTLCCSVDVSILTTTDSTAGRFTREPNKIVFPSTLEINLPFSAVSSRCASPLSAHTHTLVERRLFVTWSRRFNYLENQCDRMTEGQDNDCQADANCALLQLSSKKRNMKEMVGKFLWKHNSASWLKKKIQLVIIMSNFIWIMT